MKTSRKQLRADMSHEEKKWVQKQWKDFFKDLHVNKRKDIAKKRELKY